MCLKQVISIGQCKTPDLKEILLVYRWRDVKSKTFLYFQYWHVKMLDPFLGSWPAVFFAGLLRGSSVSFVSTVSLGFFVCSSLVGFFPPFSDKAKFGKLYFIVTKILVCPCVRCSVDNLNYPRVKFAFHSLSQSLGLVQLKTFSCLREICRPLNITWMIKLRGKIKFLYVSCILVDIPLASPRLK